MRKSDSGEAGDVSIAREVAWLASPAAWPDGTTAVRTIETNMPWVFLAGEVVRELKKPIRTTVLDFHALVARERNCRTEVRLNRRLELVDSSSREGLRPRVVEPSPPRQRRRKTK